MSAYHSSQYLHKKISSLNQKQRNLVVKNTLHSTFTASLADFKFYLSNTISSAAPQIPPDCIGGCWD
jgi:hypothetical protein